MIFENNFASGYEKKILGISDTWSMSRSSQRPSLVYYIEDCRILSKEDTLKLLLNC